MDGTSQPNVDPACSVETPNCARRWSIPHCPIPIFIAILLGIVLRTAWLNDKPLWEDEAWTFVTAVGDKPLIDTCAADPHPLSFYWFTRQLPAWFFSSDWAFRLPQAVASCIALLLLPAVCRRLLLPTRTFDRGPPEASPIATPSLESLIRWCVLVFALLPLNVRYAQDARAYAFCQLTGVLVLLAYLECRQRPTWSRVIALAAATTLSMHIDGFGWITPFIAGLHALIGIRRKDARRTIAALVAGVLLAAPYLSYRMMHMLAAGEMHAVGSGRLGKAFAARWLELSPIGVAFDPIPARYQFAIWFVAGVTAIVFFVGMATTVWQTRDSRRWLPVLLFVVPFAALTALSIASGEIYISKKYLIPTAPAVVLLFSLGFFRLTRGSLVSALLVLLIVPLGVSGVSNVRDGDRADWRGLYHQMQSRIESRDVFVQQRHRNYPEYSFGPLRAYAWRDGFDLNTARMFEYAKLAEAEPEIVSFAADAGADRVWAVTTHWMANDRSPGLNAIAEKVVELKARGCRAVLWQLHRPTSQLPVDLLIAK